MPNMEETIVLYPSPGMGHLISMVELGKLILHHYNHQFSITIFLITTDFWTSPSLATFINNVSETHPKISFRHFPLISVDTTPTRSRPAMVFECIRLNVPYVVQSLEEIAQTSKIRAFVIDLFCSSALSVGRQLDLPTFYFFTSGAAVLAAFLYIPIIHDQHVKSFQDLTDVILHFPGMSPLRANHMPEPTLVRDDPAYDDLIFFCSSLAKANGIIVNTFDDLEPKAIKTIKDGACVPDAPTPPIYCIGPLIASGGMDVQHECLSWLDKQPSKSVVFLCFGSRGSFSVQQVREIANGLERSGQRFLWVVKKPPIDDDGKTKQTEDMSDFDLEALLPAGFLKRVEDRGLVVKSWVPQVALLSRDAVGGFVTHCGWNSVLETVIAGVPMIAWPLYAEQHMNRVILVDDLKMAIAVDQRDDDGFVTGAELEKRVRELMESEKGRELKARSWMMREKALASMAESGSSTRAVAKLVQAWK